MGRLTEIDLAISREPECVLVMLRHILALEREHNAMDAALAQRKVDDSLAEPERILPSGRDMWEMKIGRQAVNTEHCYALRQQTTVEAICVWLEKIAHRQCASDMCRILRADAERVVREAGGGE